MRTLIVNADDLGYDPEIDRGILAAHARGLVTSATLMVDGPSAAAAVDAAPRSLGLGLHVVLDPSARASHVEGEVERQLARFRLLAGRAPTHLDAHKHAHARADLAPAFAAAAAAWSLPVRSLDALHRAILRDAGVRTTDALLGDAALRPCWTPDRLRAALDAVDDGTTELMCHPGHRPVVARTSFAGERELELAALTDLRARAQVEALGIALATWSSAPLR